MSFDAARIALDAGIMPFTIGGDVHGYTIRRRDENRVWGTAFGGAQGELTTIGGTGAFSLVQVMNERQPGRAHQDRQASEARARAACRPGASLEVAAPGGAGPRGGVTASFTSKPAFGVEINWDYAKHSPGQ
jgi:hypothetical protein